MAYSGCNSCCCGAETYEDGKMMRVYNGTFDGRNDYIVAAKNQKEAAKLLGVSLYHLREYGHATASERKRKIALSAPGTVFRCPASDMYRDDAVYAPIAPCVN